MIQTRDYEKSEQTQLQDGKDHSFGGMRCRLTYDDYEAMLHEKSRKNRVSFGTFWTILMFLLVVTLVSVGIILFGILFMKGAAKQAVSGGDAENGFDFSRERITAEYGSLSKADPCVAVCTMPTAREKM